MSLRRAAAAVATCTVALVVALAVPFSQLRTFAVVSTCCCPDPSHCHCPDHEPDHSGQPGMRACHRESHEVVSPASPSFAAPRVEVAFASPRVVPASIVPLGTPHTPPPPADPDGPS